MRTVIIIQARMNSSRLPGKVLKPLAARPLLTHVVERCKRAQKADVVAVATSTERSDDPIAALCKHDDIFCIRGPLDDVLARYVRAGEETGAERIVRITADCPLVDPRVIDSCITTHETSSADYVSNVNPVRTFPHGLDVEVFSFKALETAAREAYAPYDREHVTSYIYRNDTGAFRIGPAVIAPKEYVRPYRLCVDYPEDFTLMEKLYERFYTPGSLVSVPQALSFLDVRQDVAAINADCEQRS